jgi:hypothetical protein
MGLEAERADAIAWLQQYGSSSLPFREPLKNPLKYVQIQD